jgi:dTMP kinase
VKRGRFVTLEGIEGAGKSSVIPVVQTALERNGVGVVRTREPGGTPLAERVRDVVLERGAEPLAPVAELLLMFAARRIHLDSLVRPALERGDWVLCDRFTDATRAYQGGGRGMSAELIERLAREVHGDLAPDRTLLLDVPVEVGLARARARRGTVDRFEVEDVAFHERVRRRYLELAAAEPGRFRVIDASRPFAEVAAAADSAVSDMR